MSAAAVTGAAAVAVAVVAADPAALAEVADAARQLLAPHGLLEPQGLLAALGVAALVYGAYRRLVAPPSFRPELVGQPRTVAPGEPEAAAIARLPALREELGESYRAGRTRPYAWRIQQLRGLEALVKAHSDEIFEACRADCNKGSAEWFFERKGILGDCAMAIAQLHEWMKPVGAKSPFWMQPASSYILHEPLGTVLIVSPWNYPITLALHPLIGAFAAGNAAVLKPSELAPAQSRVLAKLLPKYIDSSALGVVEGGVEVSKALLAQSWDFVFCKIVILSRFVAVCLANPKSITIADTGGPTVGSIVAQTCSKSLTPFCLELGGKSPTIVDEHVDLSVACNRIVQGKFVNSGQTCIAPDYVLVHANIKDKFLANMASAIDAQFGSDPSKSPNYARVINDQHWERVTGYLKDVTAQVVHGGSSDRSTRYVAPTLVSLTESDLQKPIMQDEIFGPLLPVLAVESIDAAIDFVNARPKPLAAYVFTSDGGVAQRVVAQTTSGSACVNEAVFQYLNSHLPFGGVGPSGVGAYHGRASFDEFSHAKSVLEHSTWLDRVPPYFLRYSPHPNKPWVQAMFDVLMDL